MSQFSKETGHFICKVKRGTTVGEVGQILSGIASLLEVTRRQTTATKAANQADGVFVHRKKIGLEQDDKGDSGRGFSWLGQVRGNQ